MTTTIASRQDVPVENTWDLASLYESDAAWETDFIEWEKLIAGFESFRGTLGRGPAEVLACLEFDSTFERLGERLGTYAFLKSAEDTSNSVYQGLKARYMGIASQAAQASSYIRPELLALPESTLASYQAAPELANYRIVLERLIRQRPHTLSDAEERLLALQLEMSQTARQAFEQLNNADLDFGTVRNSQGEEIELSHATFSACLHSQDRELRRQAFHAYYAEYHDHAHTLAALLAGSVHRDIYYARVRHHQSSLEAALFEDNVPISVYTNLLDVVKESLPHLHYYYDVRRRAMKIDQLHFYDTYVPIVAEYEMKHTWDQAVQLVVDSLTPLGSDYTQTLAQGLKNRWCDRYENRGKLSGAFSCGSYDGDPYILMNYKEDVLDHVFTLAHEAGHSMHSYYSAKSQPFQYYNYSIFVAEVASTFNEQLLSNRLIESAQSRQQRAYFINRELDAIRGTIYRQTMFAEFEKQLHEMGEANEPLTRESIEDAYAKLIELYHGPDVRIDRELRLEGFRIPHFYRAFYVYKYATGMSAALALATAVRVGEPGALDRYLAFLRSGCSQFPLDLLRDAGVDMSQPKPVAVALERFQSLVRELDELLTT